ncbi:MAG: sulfite exporter TauE/SafE family protein [Candidatus Brocadiales bacterium]
MVALFLISAFIVAAAATVVGFGSATMLTPLAATFFDIKKAIVLVAFFHFFSNISRVGLFRGNISWRLIPLYGGPLLISCFVGAWLLKYLPSDTLRFVFGIFLVLFVLSSFFSPKVTLNPSNAVAVCGGLTSGFVSGLLGTGGAIRTVFLQIFGLDRDAYIATNAGLALMADLVRIPVYLTTGAVNPHREDVMLIPLLIVVAYVGTLVGRQLAQRIPQDRFRQVVLVGLFFAGLSFIFRGVNGQ